MKLHRLVFLFCLMAMATGNAFGQSSNKTEGSGAAKQVQGSDNKGSGTKLSPVPFANRVAKLGPSNSKIEFIGIHVGDDPKPRLGGFEKFKGEVRLSEDNTIESLSLQIDMNSIWTEFENLTTHLKNADFFETDQFGTAEFTSTKIEASEKGMTVTGNLLLHGQTKEISFPVTGKLGNSGLLMTSEFKLDRTMFGMDKMTSGVDKSVSVKFVVGEKTKPRKAMPGPGTNKKKSAATKQGPETQLISIHAPNML